MTWKHLEELVLSNNNIGDGGASEVASNRIWKNLKVLSLETNKIEDMGGFTIARNNHWNKLEELYLYNNNFSETCLSKFQANNWKQIRNLICNITNKRLQEFVETNLEIDYVDFESEELNDLGAIVLGRCRMRSIK